VLNRCPQYSISPAGSANISQCICQPNSTQINGACNCNDGFILDAQSRCAVCPANSFCPDQYTVRSCSNNGQSLPGQSSPMSCNFCQLGYFQYSQTTSPISCRKCTPGNACPNATTEIPCQAGEYSSALGTECLTCPANTYSTEISPSCTACDVNALASAGSKSYLDCNCNDGYFREGVRCIACPAGVGCTNNRPTPCAPGSFSLAKQTTCTPCGAGTYQSNTGSSKCDTCPGGAKIQQTTYATERYWPSVVSRPNLDTDVQGGLYFALNDLVSTQTYTITSWAFWGSTIGCKVTPYIFEGTYAQGQTGSITFRLKATGAQRTVTTVGAQNFSFGGSDAPYVVPEYPTTIDVNTQQLTVAFLAWSFEGDACIPWEAVAQSSFSVFKFGKYINGLTTYVYNDPGDASKITSGSYSINVGGKRTVTLDGSPSGSTSSLNCTCPDGTRQISTGQCQNTCPDGFYIKTIGDTACSLCPQGSFCANSIISPCPPNTASLPGASACVPCVNPGASTNIQLYTCGLKNCSALPPVELAPSVLGLPWRGLGNLTAGVGSVNGVAPTPWSAGDTVVGMVLNPASDRPFALIQRDIDLTDLQWTNIAIQFRYQYTGVSQPEWLAVAYSQDNGLNFETILTVNTFGSSFKNWIKIATAFFSPVTGLRVQLRFTAQLRVSSSTLWLGDLKIVNLGAWAYDDISKLRLLTTETVNVPRFSVYNGYNEPVPATNMMVAGASILVNLSTVKIYQQYPYVASLWAQGLGTVTIAVNDVDNVTNTIDSQNGLIPAVPVTIPKTTKPPVYFSIKTTGNVIIKAPSILLISPVVGCQTCLKNNWCSNNAIYDCPTNSQSAAGSSQQNECWCVPGYYGKVGSLVGYTPCTICPIGSFCKGGNHLEVCPNGTIANTTGQSSCIPCPEDEYCANGRKTSCPGHATSPISSWDVTQCICDPGYYGIAPDCKPCEPGFYCFNGSKTACTPNAVSPALASDPTQCYCDRGYYGVSNQACTACPEASYCWTGVQTACPVNMWSPMFSSFPTNCTCDYGTYPVQAACSGCAAGSYKSARGPGACTTCGSGSFSTARAAVSNATCLSCAPGTYSITVGAYQCQACQAGFYASGVASSACTNCWAGSYAPVGASVCSMCTAGTFSTTVAATAVSTCKMCQLGAWSYANSTACTLCGACPYWQYPPMIYFYAQPSVTVLTNTAQRYKFAVSALDGTVFMAMGTSVYKVDLTSGALSAPVGVQGPSTISWWFASLSTSVLGNYLYVIRNADVYRVDLEMGAYDIIYPSKLATCILEDSTNPNVVLWIVQPSMVRQVDPLSASDISAYTISGATFACVNPADPATLYIVGTFGLKSMNKATGAFTTLKTGTAYTVCQVTQDGSWIILSAAAIKNTIAFPLLKGGTSNIITGTVSGILIAGNQLVLGLDSVGVKNVTFSSADSRLCPPGQFGPYPGLKGPDACVLCEWGNLCPGGPNVTACAPGTYSTNTGQREQAQCSVCPAGSYCPGGVCSGDCSINPSTGVCSGPDCEGGNITYTCPPGSYSTQPGLANKQDCPLCIANYYCPDALTILPCPNNTQSSAGANDLSQCKCGPGYQCIITKVVHASVVLQISADRFRMDTQLQKNYANAIAASAGVDPSLVSIQGIFSVNAPPTGRRLLSHRRGSPWQFQAVEIHTLIHQPMLMELVDLDSHLELQGLPPHHSLSMSLHEEIVQSYRSPW